MATYGRGHLNTVKNQVFVGVCKGGVLVNETYFYSTNMPSSDRPSLVNRPSFGVKLQVSGHS